MRSHELARQLLLEPDLDVIASTDVSDKSVDDNGNRVFSTGMCEIMPDIERGEITLIFESGDINND